MERSVIARPQSLPGDHRFRSSKFSWFSYYQQEQDGDSLCPGLESPPTEDSHLPLTPLEDRVLSPCEDLDLEVWPGRSKENLGCWRQGWVVIMRLWQLCCVLVCNIIFSASENVEMLFKNTCS